MFNETLNRLYAAHKYYEVAAAAFQCEALRMQYDEELEAALSTTEEDARNYIRFQQGEWK